MTPLVFVSPRNSKPKGELAFRPASLGIESAASAADMRLAPQATRTYFITSNTVIRKMIFTSREMAELFISVCDESRTKKRMQIHEFVLMPDHFPLIITPATDVSLEKAVQFLKGGFSFGRKKSWDTYMRYGTRGSMNTRSRHLMSTRSTVHTSIGIQ